MLLSALHSSIGRRFWRAAVAHGMALVVLLTLLAPHPGSAAELSNNPASTSAAPAGDGGGLPGDRGDYCLVQHAHCLCHGAVTPHAQGATLRSGGAQAGYPASADTPLRPRPTALPFKPPRA